FMRTNATTRELCIEHCRQIHAQWVARKQSPGHPGLYCFQALGLLLVVVVDLFEISVDNVIASLCTGVGLAFGARVGLGGFIHGLTKLHGSLGKGVGLGLDVLDILTFRSGTQRRDGILDGLAVFCRYLVAVVLDGLLGAVDQGLSLVAGLSQLAALLVGCGVGF